MECENQSKNFNSNTSIDYEDLWADICLNISKETRKELLENINSEKKTARNAYIKANGSFVGFDIKPFENQIKDWDGRYFWEFCNFVKNKNMLQDKRREVLEANLQTDPKYGTLTKMGADGLSDEYLLALAKATSIAQGFFTNTLQEFIDNYVWDCIEKKIDDKIIAFQEHQKLIKKIRRKDPDHYDPNKPSNSLLSKGFSTLHKHRVFSGIFGAILAAIVLITINLTKPIESNCDVDVSGSNNNSVVNCVSGTPIYHSLKNATEEKCINTLSSLILPRTSDEIIPVAAECKATIFKELKIPNHFKDLDYETRFQLISEIIKSITNIEDFSKIELAELYLYRGLYSIDFSFAQFVNDLRTSYSINSQSQSSISLLKLVHSISGNDEHAPNLISNELVKKEQSQYPWGRILFSLDFISNYIDDTNRFPSSAEKIEAKFDSILDRNDHFSIIIKINLAEYQAIIHKDFSLIHKLHTLHGECNDMPNLMLSANCYKLDMISDLKNYDFKALTLSYKKGASAFQQLNGLVGEVRLLLLFKALRGKFKAKDVPTKNIKEVGKIYARLIRDLSQRGDFVTASYLKLLYADSHIGVTLQNHPKALILIKEAINEISLFLGDEKVEKLLLTTAWREFRHGDKEEGIRLEQKRFDQTIFENQEDKLWATLNFYALYFNASTNQEGRLLQQSADVLLSEILEQNLSIKELSELSHKLSTGGWYPMSGQVLDEMKKTTKGDEEKLLKYLRATLYNYKNIMYSYSSRQLTDKQINQDFIRDDLLFLKRAASGLKKEKIGLDKFTKDIKKIEEGLNLRMSDKPNKSKKDKFRDYILSISQLDDDLYSLNEHADKVIESWKKGIKENIQGEALLFMDAKRLIRGCLEDLFKPYEKWYVGDNGKGMQVLTFPQITDITDIGVLKAALKLLKFIQVNSENIAYAELKVDLLALGALTASALKNEPEKNYFVSKAILKIEDPDEFREHDIERDRDVEVIIMHTKKLMEKCLHIEAIQLIEKYKKVFSVIPNYVDQVSFAIFELRKNCVVK